jgi:hypothetical protein
VFAKVFSDSNGIEQLPPKTQTGILRLLETVSRHPEGQLFVARVRFFKLVEIQKLRFFSTIDYWCYRFFGNKCFKQG